MMKQMLPLLAMLVLAPGAAPGAARAQQSPCAAVVDALLQTVAAGDAAAVRRFLEAQAAPAFRDAPLAQHVVTPEAMDARHPKARRAAEVVRLVLAGDSEAALARLGHDPAEPATEPLEQRVRQLAEQLGTSGRWEIEGFQNVGELGLIVRLKQTVSDDRTSLFIRMEPREPYRITGFELPRPVQMRDQP